MRDYIKQKRHLFSMIALAVLVCIISLCIYLLEIRPKVSNLGYDININNDYFSTSKYTLSSDSIVSQTFTSSECITGVKIGLKCYDSNIRGNVYVTLTDVQKNILVAKWKYNFEGNNSNLDYKDGYLSFKMENDPNCILSSKIYNEDHQEKTYKLQITSDNDNKYTSPVVYVTNQNTYSDGNLFIDGQYIDGDLYLKVSCEQGYYISKLFIFISVITIIFVMIAYYVIFVREYKVHNVFLVCATILGFIYMIIMTPYSISDESKHINTAYRYSNLILGKNYQTEKGYMLKRRCDIQDYNLAMKPSVSTYYGVTSHFFDKVTDEEKELIEVPGEKVGNVWQYIPTSIGITVARVLNLGFIPLVYVGRIFNFAFFISMIYLGLKKLPFGKITMFTIAMMPMCLHQGMSFSYDAIVYGLAFVFISYIIYIAFTDKKLQKRDFVVPIITMGVLATCKAGIFIFLSLICFIIPKNKFPNKKKYFEAIGGIIAFSILMLVVFNVIKITKAVTMTTNDNLQDFAAMTGYTYIDILKDPGNFIYTVYSTILDQGDFYVLSTIGAYLSWSTLDSIEVSKVIIILFMVIIMLSALKTQEEPIYLNIKTKIIFAVVPIIIFGAFMAVAYTWTPYGRNIIFGLQGRYFVTFLPLLVFLLRNNTIILKRDISKQIMFSMCILEIITVLNLFSTIAIG